MQTDADIRRIVQLLGLPMRQNISKLWFSDELSKGLPLASLERVQAQVAPGLDTFTNLIVAEGTLTGSKLYPGRWNDNATPVIYASRRYSTAMLEKLDHANGIRYAL
jgi:hypothetical protein